MPIANDGIDVERPACIRSVRQWSGQHHRHGHARTGLRLATACDHVPGVGEPSVIVHHGRNPDRSPLHDVRKHARGRKSVQRREMVNFRTSRLQRLRIRGRARPVWWSQTGSNRRPPACKAGALPAELWPLQRTVISDQQSHDKRAFFLITDTGLLVPETGGPGKI
jgi:hypothetical protein